MTKLGFALSSEENHPNDLVKYAQMAEDAGFEFLMISDHFHPWVDAQGHSPLVWAVLGAIANATSAIPIGTGVTCPTIRIHPAVIAQAAATIGAMMPGRFWLGVGTGENLNEHILGDKWPTYEERAWMLEEAIHVIRELWKGEVTTCFGTYYTIENASIYTLPDELPPIYVAASGEESSEMAGELGDGFISTAPKQKLVDIFHQQGDSKNRPALGQYTVSYHKDKTTAVDRAYKIWPNAALHGQLSQELPSPPLFEQACENVSKEDVEKVIICGADPDAYIEMAQKYIDAGFDHVYVHNVGEDQKAFMDFYKAEVMPALR